MDLQELRDLVLVIFGIAGTVLFIVAALVLITVGAAVRALVADVKRAIREGILPTAQALREAVNTIRGTTGYLGQTALSPLMRVYAAVAALRKASGMLSRRRREKAKEGA